MPFSKELNCATDAALKAGIIQREKQSRVVNIGYKADSSPVTEVDKQCEELIRDILFSSFPDDGFIGEETGNVSGKSGRTWIVDPLDGTIPYIRGIPTYSILIALEYNETIVAGVAHFPALEETYRASKGYGAFCNNRRIYVSSTENISSAIGSSLGLIDSAETSEGKKLLSFIQQWYYHYGFMDAYSYICVASGKLDLCINLSDKPWDRAAAACVVTEAGGKYSDIKGNKTIKNSSFILSNGVLQSQIIKHFE